MAVTILLVRHGKTQGNLERRYIGATDQPLCPQGRSALAALSLPPADRVYASPMARCRETAALLFPGQQAELVPDFRECDFGAFEGRTYEELKEDGAYRAWLGGGGMAAPPGGESKAAQGERTLRAFLSIAGAFRDGETAALVVHGGTIMALLEALEASHDFYRWQAPNGGGFRCRWDGRALAVEGALQGA